MSRVEHVEGKAEKGNSTTYKEKINFRINAVIRIKLTMQWEKYN